MADPFPGLPPNLIPNPPSDVPEAAGAGDATQRLSPFLEALDVDAIIANFTPGRTLKLFIPDKHLYPDFEFHIINSIPQEFADARNKGFREVTRPGTAELFQNLVAGTDKTGKAYHPVLMARPKKVGDHARKLTARQLNSLYQGMDPSNKEFNSPYAKPVGEKDGTFLQRRGATWRIRA